MMPMYRGEDGAATCARAAAAAAELASDISRAVLVATFLRTLDLGTTFLHDLRCVTPSDHRDRTPDLLAYGVKGKTHSRCFEKVVRLAGEWAECGFGGGGEYGCHQLTANARGRAGCSGVPGPPAGRSALCWSAWSRAYCS